MPDTLTEIRPTGPLREAGNALIELRDIRKTYVRGDIATEVLHGISLEIHAGEFVAIMGASGSGKSTLMNILGCLDRPTEGGYFFSGHDVADFSRDELAGLRRDAFGFVFQSYNLIAGATALENVEMPGVYAGMARDARERAKSTGDKIGNSVDDAWIHTKIAAKLMTDSDTPSRKINVDVVNGAVTLRGAVNSEVAKKEAERIARETDGVKKVTNLLKIQAS